MLRLKVIIILTLIFASETAFSQLKRDYFYRLADSKAPINLVYLHLSDQNGKVLNTEYQPLQNGIGGTVSALIPDMIFNKHNRNYFSLGVKGLNSPHPGAPYLSTMNIRGDKEIDDSFNYFQVLTGYRVSERIRNNGIYFEQRFGYIFWDFHDNDKWNHAIVVVPSFGYVYKNYDFAVFGDVGFSQRRTNIAKNVFYTLGISIGYNFGMYKVNSCRCEPYYW